MASIFVYVGTEEEEEEEEECRCSWRKSFPLGASYAHRAGRTLSVASASAGDVLQGPQQFVEVLSVIQRAETVRAIASLVIGDTNV